MEMSQACWRLPSHGTVLGGISDPWFLVRQAILGARMRKNYEAVASRRPPLAAVRDGVDRGLTLGFETGPWKESRKAALRVVLTGGVIVQNVASKWVLGGQRCPHC